MTERVLKLFLSFSLMMSTALIADDIDAAADAAAALRLEADGAMKSQEGRLEAAAGQIRELIGAAENHLNQDDFASAQAEYDKAVKIMDDEGMSGPYVDKTIKIRVDGFKSRLDYRWAKYYESKAREKYLEDQLDQAKRYANRAIGKCPALKDNLSDFINMCNRKAYALEFRQQVAPDVVDPEKEARETGIESLDDREGIKVSLAKAKVFFDNKRYMEARDCCERILIQDPYNLPAMNLLTRIYRKIYFVATLRRENEILERNAENIWKWSEPILPTENILPPQVGPVENSGNRSGLYEKLQKMILEAVDFEDAPISAILTYLNERSRQLDPDKVGISILINLPPDELASIPPVSMNFDSIPIGEVIRYLCQAAGLKYRIEESAVIIGKDNIDNMDTQFFNVRAAVIQEVVNPAGESDSSDSDAFMESGGDLFDASTGISEAMSEDAGGAGMAASATSEALMKYFSDRGVPFPGGSTIAYDRRAGKLIVKNTPDNLRRLEALLRDIDIQTPLVLIEAKIVEITQRDLEELGFDWVFWDVGNANPDYNNPNSPNYQQGNEFSTWVVDKTDKILRSYGGAGNINTTNTDDRSSELIKNLQLVPNFGPNNDRNIQLTVNAIEQSGRGEVLSAPKVIATSGTTALIRMVREEFFPESWTEPEISITEAIVEYTPSYPEFGDATDIGVRFEVTPTVSPNNYTISLSLHPQVVALADWTTYDYAIQMNDVRGSVTLKMPELSRRDVISNVKVYDGETVVLGGMLQEDNAQRDDKIPFAGDIPVVGRLFRSTMDNFVKRNLLFFVTARLISGDGVSVRKEALRGVPDFNR